MLTSLAALTSLVSFFMSTGLDSPVVVGEVVDAFTPSWDAVEVGVFGALLVGGLPFFVLSQSRPTAVVGPTLLSGLVSLSAGLIFISTSSLWLMFVSFEFLLLSALYMLLLTSKSERARDAALEMFI